MKKQMIISGLTALLLVAAACSSPAPANKASTTTNTTTTSTTNANKTNPPANSNNAAPANTNQTTNTSETKSESQTAKQDFTLVNQTGVEIHRVYITPHSSNNWEEDILGRDTLPSGESVDIKFHRSEKAAQWDLRVEDKDGNSIEWENLNLLEISKVTLHYKDGKATADTE
ncbi:MAG TPA: hypothetical protein VE821_15580 [Pyrinomonadaceae bacterium]|nr:hypothetical protein [Pyrinomonadaceae bacterium]